MGNRARERVRVVCADHLLPRRAGMAELYWSYAPGFEGTSTGKVADRPPGMNELEEGGLRAPRQRGGYGCLYWVRSNHLELYLVSIGKSAPYKA